ncbi:hypothetical protein [Acuticoccus kandeliae]|uniref:hypothetical protein n=1 Tax=Acuticoccus kandeliae TaxID=2073160 RepID=UPI000D3E3805|nr:hypothetical protein [Acuticoccus kandeliae]
MAISDTSDPHNAVTGEEPAEAKAALRKADAWTSGVLAIIAILMIAKATTFPLEGNYAGVKNAWYVSPALFPLIVGGFLFVLSMALMAKAVSDYRRLSGGSILAIPFAAAWTKGQDVIIVGLLLTGYIVGLVPRIDFVAATAIFLIVFMFAYLLPTQGQRYGLVAAFSAGAALVFLVSLVTWPPVGSDGQKTIDLVVWALAAVAAVFGIAVSSGPLRRRAVQATVTSLVTALFLSAAFKYFLLVPLPKEGWTIGLMDAVRSAIRAWGA